MVEEESESDSSELEELETCFLGLPLEGLDALADGLASSWIEGRLARAKALLILFWIGPILANLIHSEELSIVQQAHIKLKILIVISTKRL